MTKYYVGTQVRVTAGESPLSDFHKFYRQVATITNIRGGGYYDKRKFDLKFSDGTVKAWVYSNKFELCNITEMENLKDRIGSIDKEIRSLEYEREQLEDEIGFMKGYGLTEISAEFKKGVAILKSMGKNPDKESVQTIADLL